MRCLGGMPESSLVASAVSERTGNVTQKALPCRSSRGPADPRRGETAGARLSVRDGPLPPQTWRFGKPPGQLVLCPLHLVVRLWSRASLDTGGTRTGQMAGSPRARPAARTAGRAPAAALRGPLRDALLPAPREEHAAMFSFVYLKIITQKNIWRNVIFS